MEPEYLVAKEKAENAIETMQGRDGVKRVSLFHLSGVSVVTDPDLPNNNLKHVANLFSGIYQSIISIHDQNWEYFCIESSYAKTVILPLFFQQEIENIPFFLQIETQPQTNLQNLFLNISNSLGILSNNLQPIHAKLGQSNDLRINLHPKAMDDTVNSNPKIAVILNNFFGTHSSLDIETVLVFINNNSNKTMDSLGGNQLEIDILTTVKLPNLISLVKKVTKYCTQYVKPIFTSLVIECPDNFHFVYPIHLKSTSSIDGFISITTKNKAKIGLLQVVLYQVIKKIEQV